MKPLNDLMSTNQRLMALRLQKVQPESTQSVLTFPQTFKLVQVNNIISRTTKLT